MQGLQGRRLGKGHTHEYANALMTSLNKSLQMISDMLVWQLFVQLVGLRWLCGSTFGGRCLVCS